MTRTGTSYFITFAKAVRYYARYSPELTTSELHQFVGRKIADGEIHIGEPPIHYVREYRRLDEDGRYEVVQS